MARIQIIRRDDEMDDGTWSRRTFLKTMGSAAGLAVSGSVHLDGASPGASFVDIHTHITHRWGNRPAFHVEDLLRFMDAHAIEQAAVLPLVSPLAWDHPVSTDYVLEQTRPHRDRLIPFCAVDPRSNQWGRSMADKLEQYVEAGARGFGEHKVGLPIDHPLNMELFAACGELGLPVLFHLDSLRNTDQPGLPGLERVLRELPDVNMIGHAQGWWASISEDVTEEDMQGYPDTEVVPGGTIDRLMDAYPNLYGDLSAGSGFNAISRDPEFGRDFLIRRADRLLFGTDVLRPGQNVPQIAFYRSLDLPEAVQEKLFRGNARRLILGA